MKVPFPVPETLYVELTTECNLRCKQCHMWRTKKERHALTTEEKCNVVAQFADINSSGAVVFTGGETFMDVDELFTLSSLCRRLGLKTVTNSNGTYLDANTVLRTIANGPNVLVLSLDSHDEQTHDFIRGVPGTYRAVLAATERLVQARQASPRSDTKVYLSGILCELTLEGASSLVEFARGTGADGIAFQMLAPTFMLARSRDRFFDRYWFHNTDHAKAVIRALAVRYSEDPFVMHTANDFHWMSVYVDYPQELPQPVCGSHERNVWVDMYGNTQLCAFMSRILDGDTLGNVRNTSLSDMLQSAFATKARGIMNTCTRTCGMLICHRRH